MSAATPFTCRPERSEGPRKRSLDVTSEAMSHVTCEILRFTQDDNLTKGST
jgi:hypothetical protein